MKLLTLCASVTLASWGAQAWSCLSDADAQSIADRSAIFLSHTDVDIANQTAQGLFADNIIEFGDSINSLRGDPINTLAIVHGCSQMVWQWEFIGIGPQFRIRGMTLITVDSSNKVVQQYVEFNSLAWAIDIGFNVTPPANGPFSR